MKIFIKYHNPKCKLESFGNWMDLKSAEKIKLFNGESKILSLGVSMKLPKYYQANIVPRSSSFKKFGFIQTNHYAVIDGPDNNSDGYCGNDDIWKYSIICLDKMTVIDVGDRICQFEIKPTFNAPWYVKLKYLFTNKIKFIEVDDLKTKNRGGLGSTGK